MDRSDIADAITLFQFSQTVANGGRATQVLQTLLDLFQRNEIGFADLPRRTLRGRWRSGRAGFDLQINNAYVNQVPAADKLPALSLLLVHEGTHATDNFDSLYSELAARILPAHYYRELAGPGVFNEADDPPRPGRRSSGIVRIAEREHFALYREQSEALRQEQLIDYILDNDTYTTSTYIDADWITNNFGNWGGIANRWPGTRGLYVKILAATYVQGRHYMGRLLDVLESVTTQADWDAILAAGSLRRLRLALDEASTHRPYGDRIARLERRWRISLTEKIPV
jgi:hypothetical protein